MLRRTWLLCSVLAAFAAVPAFALPILSVDADTSAAGIQDSATHGVGDSFTVDILISDVASPDSLNGFQLGLAFDPSVLSAVSVTGGDFLVTPVYTLQADVNTGSVAFAEVTLGPGGAVGSGTLATVEFQVIGLGTSGLGLGDVLLSQPFGQPLEIGALQGGSITVGAVPGVPEPSGALVFAAGMLIVGLRLRHQ